MPSLRLHRLRIAPLGVSLLLLGVVLLAAGCDESTSKSKSITPAPHNAAGGFDANFGLGGYVTFQSPSVGPDAGYAVTTQADGKILVAGIHFNGTTSEVGVWRFMPSGLPDAAFGVGGLATQANATGQPDAANGILRDANGNILVTGQRWNTGTSSYDMIVWRFFGNGVFDTLFADPGPTANDNDVGNAITQDAAGNYVVVGTSNDTGVQTNLVVWRVLGDMSGPDTTFGTFSSPGPGWMSVDAGSGGIDTGTAVAIQPDGKIVAVGQGFSGSVNQLFLVRLANADGALDTGFGTAGIVLNTGLGDPTAPTGIVIQSDGKIVVAGSTWNSTNLDAMLWRFTTTGTLDTSFGMAGTRLIQDVAGATTPDQINGLAQDGSGRLLITGAVGSPTDMFAARLTSGGNLDGSFGSGGILQDGALASGTAPLGRAIAVASNGYVFVAGEVTSVSDLNLILWKVQ